MKISQKIFPLAALFLLCAGCGANRLDGPADQRDVALHRSELQREAGSIARTDGPSSVSGEIGPGSSYFLHVPEGWNGDLVLYVHGYTAPPFPLGPPPTEPVDALRDQLLARGFAFGYSTFSENGYALRDAVQRTQQLQGLFASRFEPPRRTYLLGYSMGGLAVLNLLERHPESFAGAVTVSGILGGTRRELEYVGNVWVLFDLLYPGVLPWALYAAPDVFDPNQIIGPVVAAIQANPQPALILSQIAQTPIPFSNGQELVESIVQALVLQAIALNDLRDRTHGHEFFENANTTYTGKPPADVLAGINAAVARYASTPDADAWVRQQYEPTGNLQGSADLPAHAARPGCADLPRGCLSGAGHARRSRRIPPAARRARVRPPCGARGVGRTSRG
jgi:pimeloyl-ACP methyl ester carboxylesterase